VTRNRALLAGVAALTVAVVTSAWAYPTLPATVPTHWNLAGQVNGYSSRFFAVAFAPAIAALMWLLMLVLPKISPRGFRLAESADAFYAAMLAVIAVIVVIHLMLVRAAVTGAQPSVTVLFLLLGALFVVIGAVMGRLKRNFWIGVRTPWTLANDEVWQRTNHLAGRLLVAGGLFIALSSFFPRIAIAVILIVLFVIAFTSLAYSYVLYRRIEGFGSD